MSIEIDSKDVGEDAYCLDVSYDNSDGKFTGDGPIRQAVDAENGSVPFAGQGVGSIRTVTLLMPLCDNMERVALALVDGGYEVAVFPADQLHDCHLPVRYRLAEPIKEFKPQVFAVG
jgi:hypothetical protein